MTMTRKKAIQILSTRDWSGMLCGYTSGYTEALDMAIEALQFVEHFDLLKEFQSLQEVVRCKNCKHQDYCHETIARTKEHDGFREHWSEAIEWCSRGERKGDNSE